LQSFLFEHIAMGALLATGWRRGVNFLDKAAATGIRFVG
jgi:hypothetical protein